MTQGIPLTETKRRQMRAREGGYALMMVIFFVALLAIAAMAAGPRILVDGKREKEQEMIWRGKQYVRGVKMYYRKLGRFPTSVDDLTKPKVGSLRFMRQAYKDPMNSGDGSWRLIYVGPAGQLIGSLKPPQTLQFPGAGGGLGTPASTMAANSAQQPGGLGSSTFGSFGNSTGAAGSGAAANSNPQTNGQPNQPNAQPNGDQANPQATGTGQTPADGTQAAGTDASGAAAGGDAMSTPQAIAPSESPSIIGGNIIGVGSKAVAPSLIVYEKAKNYHLFEFIWDPSKDVTLAGQPGMQTGTGLGQNVGSNPGAFGQQQPGATNPPAGTTIPGTAGAPTPNNPPPNNPPEAPLDSTPPPEPEPQQ
jgi:hypothetical protein